MHFGVFDPDFRTLCKKEDGSRIETPFKASRLLDRGTPASRTTLGKRVSEALAHITRKVAESVKAAGVCGEVLTLRRQLV